jgi:hypothetical protein
LYATGVVQHRSYFQIIYESLSRKYNFSLLVYFCEFRKQRCFCAKAFSNIADTIFSLYPGKTP